MILERIVTPQLALYSYFLADQGQGVVIDPRRDVQVYLDLARDHNVEIKGILETHRHEDHVLGSKELAALTGATIYRSSYEDFAYPEGDFMKEGDVLPIGSFNLKALHTPGHTKGHLAFVLMDAENPYAVFSGDALFYGEVGRSDFYGEDKLEEMTGLVYDSIQKIAALGDHVLLYPAHGAGSACGANIRDIPLSSIGHEKATSPVFAPQSREDFINTYAKMQFKPAYFSLMEEWNITGAPFVGDSLDLRSISSKELMESLEGRAVVDVRHIGDFSYQQLPGALFMGSGMLSKAMGVLLTPDQDIILVTDGLSPEEKKTAYWTLRRMGFDHILGQVGDHMHIGLAQGGVYLPKRESLSPPDFLMVAEEEDLTNLDLRFPREIKREEVEFTRVNIPLDDLPSRLEELDKEQVYVTSCETGLRALVGASYLTSLGYKTKHIRGNLNFVDENV